MEHVWSNRDTLDAHQGTLPDIAWMDTRPGQVGSQLVAMVAASESKMVHASLRIAEEFGGC